ncbi:MAG: tetratricopeptide repeat protein [Candidatus Omnitrophica bacterium]|nr:tetratricopeptide repeat protein [Candidatus Omnitrophota bacterium]
MRISKTLCGIGAAVLCVVFAVAAGAQNPGDKENSSDNARRYYQEGKDLMSRGDYAGANEAYKKAQQILENNKSAFSPSAVPGPAVVKENKKNSRIIETAAEYDAQGNVKEALSYYLKAVALFPKNANLYYNLGVEYIKNGQFKEAAQAFLTSIQLNPKDKDAYYNLGIVYDQYLNDKQKASDFYRMYLNLAPDSEDASTVKNWIQ